MEATMTLFQGTFLSDVRDEGALIPISQIMEALQDVGYPDLHLARREFEDRLSRDGWHYLIAHDAWAPPSVIARLRAGGDLSGVEVAPVYSRAE
jgi:hypothetical protein